MSEATTKLSCINCSGEGEFTDEHRVTGRPDGWGTALIVTNAGIVTNSLLCDLCLTAIKNALADRRVDDSKSVPDVEPEEEKAPEPKQSSRAKRRAAAPEKAVEEKAADAAPISEVAPEDTLPVSEDAPEEESAK